MLSTYYAEGLRCLHRAFSTRAICHLCTHSMFMYHVCMPVTLSLRSNQEDGSHAIVVYVAVCLSTLCKVALLQTSHSEEISVYTGHKTEVCIVVLPKRVSVFHVVALCSRPAHTHPAVGIIFTWNRSHRVMACCCSRMWMFHTRYSVESAIPCQIAEEDECGFGARRKEWDTSGCARQQNAVRKKMSSFPNLGRSVGAVLEHSRFL